MVATPWAPGAGKDVKFRRPNFETFPPPFIP
jgi:hypothetical protein